MITDIDLVLPVNEESFPFRLCRSDLQLGAISIDQWWMRKDSLEPTRRQEAKARNFRPVVEYFRAQCQAQAAFEADALEAYLLARLLPHSRSNGARFVFDDAVLQPQATGARDRVARRESDASLDDRLRGDLEEQKMSNHEFNRHTAQLIGRNAYPEETWDLYRKFAASLFDDGRDVLRRGNEQSVEIILKRWLKLIEQFGRRARRDQEKLVLDVLSYECRAAFNQCYSVVWCGLLEELNQKYGLSSAACRFHEFWQKDIRYPSDRGDEADFHLFHGHIFGRHPAGAAFIRTPTGRQLIGDHLASPTSTAAWDRLLAGLLIAVFDYAAQRLGAKEARRLQPQYGASIDRLMEDRIDRRHGRLPRK